MLYFFKKISFPILSLAVLLNVAFLNPAYATTVTNVEFLPQSIGTELGLPQQDIRVTIARIIRVAMGFIGIFMVAAIIYGGFLYMTAGGNEDQAGTGKKAITAGVIGLAIVLSAWALTSFIIDQLVTATTGTGTP